MHSKHGREAAAQNPPVAALSHAPRASSLLGHPVSRTGWVLTSYRIESLMPDHGVSDRESVRQARVEEAMRRERTARGLPLMPGWDKDDEVPPHVLDLYADLSARAEGGLGPGKPALIRAKSR
jgi:hypothetical protein